MPNTLKIEADLQQKNTPGATPVS